MNREETAIISLKAIITTLEIGPNEAHIEACVLFSLLSAQTEAIKNGFSGLASLFGLKF